MIHANTSFQKTRKTEGVKIPSAKEIGKERKEVLTLLKKALEDFREGLSNSKDSYLQKTSEQKLNYLNELLKEKINGQTEDINKQISSYTIKLTDKEKKEISNELKKQFSDITPSLIDKIIGCLEDVIKNNVNKEENTSPKVKIDGKIDEDFLEKYFDELYTKSEKYQDIKDTLVNEMSESHNQNMRLIKERIQQYKDNLKSYETKIRKANSKIAELQDNKRISNNSALQNNRFENKRDRKNKEKKVKQTNNLIQDNLLTQQIVDQVRRNENLSISPKDKQLSPEHTKSANNLIDKFYKNGLIELKLKNWKNTFKGVSKILGMIISPIGWLAGKIFGVAKTIGLSLFKLGKFVFKSFENVFLVGLMSPAGAYTIGFLAGYIAEYIKDKWTNNEGIIGGIHDFWNGMVKWFINPLIKVAKFGYKLGSFIIDMVAKHPLVFGGLFLLLKGIWASIKNFSTISKGATIAKRGLLFAGPMLLGLMASAASEAIFNNTVFKEDDEKSLTYNEGLQTKYQEFSSQVNGETIANMNAIEGNRYGKLKASMDEEFDTIGKIQSDIKFFSDNYKAKDDRGKKISVLGGNLVKAVFTSRLYGFDKAGYDNFIRFESNPENDIQKQVAKLTESLNIRTSMLVRQMGALSAASKQSISVLNDTMKQMVQEDESGNVTMVQKSVDRLREHTKTKEITKDETDLLSFALFNTSKKDFELGNYDSRNLGNYSSYGGVGSEGLKLEFKKSKYILNGIKSKNILGENIVKLKDNAMVITEQYMNRFNVNNIGFTQMLGDLNGEFSEVIAKSNGDKKLLEEHLTKYLDKVREDYRKRNQSDIQNLRDDIKKSEDSIERYTKELKELGEELREYRQKGMTNG